MKRRKLSILFLEIFFLCTTLCVSSEDATQCPKPVIGKKTIIRTTDSIRNGAELLKKETVVNARDCYDFCCSTEKCNVALMHYKPDVYDEISGEAKTVKYCYLFACGSPSVCTFDYHSRYAVIKINRPQEKEDQSTNNECPPGAPVAMCSENPCDVHTCPAHKGATCEANYCGGCHAYFYDENNNRLNCNIPVTTEKPPKASNNDDVTNQFFHNEQSVVVNSTDYVDTPSENLRPVKPNTEPSKQDDNGDPYFQTDRRKWPIDGPDDEMNKNKTVATPVHDVIDVTSSMTLVATSVRPKIDSNTEDLAATYTVPVVLKHDSGFASIPLLIALIICILFVIGLIYHFKCARRGKPKKLPVDDGDYLINGMYL